MTTALSQAVPFVRAVARRKTLDHLSDALEQVRFAIERTSAQDATLTRQAIATAEGALHDAARAALGLDE